MTTIDKLIVNHFGYVPPAKARDIAASSLGYLFRVTSSSELSESIRGNVGSNVRVIDYRRDLQSGYFLKNLKLWLWRIYCRGYTPTLAARYQGKYGVETSDLELARIMHRDATLCERLEALTEDYPSHSALQYDDLIRFSLSECDQYITRFAWRKLKFLTQSGYVSIDDIINDLKYYALYGMLMQYPKVKCDLHLVNVAKRSVHNFGMNMIHQFTSQGRLFLSREADGTFSSLMVSIDYSPKALEYSDKSSNLEGNHLDASSCAFDNCDRITAATILESHSGKKKQFLSLLSGTYDQDFSNWLHARRKPDNDELLDRCLAADTVNKYVRLAAQYLSVDVKDAQSFLAQLRHKL